MGAVGILWQQLYSGLMITEYLPISQAKYHDLRKLCNQMVIPVEVHEWYNTLPTSARVVDKLPAPSNDDSRDDDDDALI